MKLKVTLKTGFEFFTSNLHQMTYYNVLYWDYGQKFLLVQFKDHKDATYINTDTILMIEEIHE